jgi:ATP-dependent Clp protease ATP-binding subunit ClpA
VDFTNTVVIMTSNIGAKLPVLTPSSTEAAGAAGAEAGVEDLDAPLRAELSAFFRPEFLNRIGDIVVFGALGKEQLHRIVDIQINRVRKLLEARNLELVVSDAAKARLVDWGYEPAFGARPLERTIVRHVQDPVAEGLLAGSFTSGQTISVDIEGEGVALRASPPSP